MSSGQGLRHNTVFIFNAVFTTCEPKSYIARYIKLQGSETNFVSLSITTLQRNDKYSITSLIVSKNILCGL